MHGRAHAFSQQAACVARPPCFFVVDQQRDVVRRNVAHCQALADTHAWQQPAVLALQETAAIHGVEAGFKVVPVCI
jgi:hypothetical protein